MDAAIVFDTEVNSFEHLEPIQLAYARYEIEHTGDLLQGTVFGGYFSAANPIVPGAAAVHGILEETIKGLPPASNAELPKTEYVVGHNVDFDWEVMGKPDVRRICTLAMARALWPDYDNHKLSTLQLYIYGMNKATMDKIKNAHDAMADVYMCADVLQAVIREKGFRTWEEIWKFSEEARIPVKMPFGKHKDELIKDLPKSYLKWAIKNFDEETTDPYLIEAIRQAMGYLPAFSS